MKQHKISQFFRRHSCARSLIAAATLATAILALPAKAEIVYTPKNVTVDPGTRGNVEELKIDLNHDGITDFTILYRGMFVGCRWPATGVGFLGGLSVEPAKGNAMVASGGYAFALSKGNLISSSQHFYYAQALMMQDETCSPAEHYGPWFQVYSHFLGFKFQINGHTHYGWARLTVITSNPKTTPSVTLTGYAYETIAGKAITTGQTTGP